MNRRLGLIAVFAWLILVWAAFLYYQQRPSLQGGHFAAYLAAFVKVLAILIVAASAGLRFMGGGPAGDRGIVPSLALGLALLGLATFALGCIGVLKPVVIWPMLAVLAAVSYRQIRTVAKRAAAVLSGGLGPLETLAVCTMAVALVVCLIGSLAPLTANDSLVYHLNLPRIYTSSGGFAELPHNVYANMPHNGEMLYTLFYAVAGETGANLFYCFGVLGATAAVYALGRRFAGREAALVGASIFLVQPLVIDHRIIANVDVMLAFFFLAAAIAGFDLRRGGGWKRLVGFALIAGFMLGLKYTAAVPFISVFMIPLASKPGGPGIRRLVIAAAIGLLVFAPWAIKNEAYVGNPVYPVFEDAFDGRNWDSVQSSQLLAWQRGMGMGRSALDYLLLPFNVSLRGKPGMNYTYFDGSMSPLLLALFPLAFLRRRRDTGIVMALALAGFLFWAFTSQQLRFLLPTAALLAVLAAAGISNLTGRVGSKAADAFVVVILLVAVSTLGIADQYGRPFVSNAFGDKLGVVTGLETRQHYLERTLQPYAMFSEIPKRLPDKEPILMIWENRGYYLDRAYVADSFFEASSLMRIVSDAGSPDQLRLRIRAMGVRHVLVNDLLGEVFIRGYDPEQAAVLREFVANHLRPLYSVNRMTLYEIAAD